MRLFPCQCNHSMGRCVPPSGRRPRPDAWALSVRLKACRRDGSQFALEVGLSFFGEGDNFRVIAACTDITELNDARKSVERAAYEDGLTGLLSRSSSAMSRTKFARL